jgi:hypothetical protein
MPDATELAGSAKPPAVSNTEHRAGQRTRQLKSGIIVFNQRRSTLACTIRDISTSGARLKLGSVVVLPDEFELIFVNDRKIVPVKKCWHSHPECGVSFSGPMSPAPPLGMSSS